MFHGLRAKQTLNLIPPCSHLRGINGSCPLPLHPNLHKYISVWHILLMTSFSVSDREDQSILCTWVFTLSLWSLLCFPLFLNQWPLPCIWHLVRMNQWFLWKTLHFWDWIVLPNCIIHSAVAHTSAVLAICGSRIWLSEPSLATLPGNVSCCDVTRLRRKFYGSKPYSKPSRTYTVKQCFSDALWCVLEYWYLNLCKAHCDSLGGVYQ